MSQVQVSWRSLVALWFRDCMAISMMGHVGFSEGMPVDEFLR